MDFDQTSKTFFNLHVHVRVREAFALRTLEYIIVMVRLYSRLKYLGSEGW